MPQSFAAPGTPFAFENLENFRELGGYRGHGGKCVRHGALYRAPALNALQSPHDLALFAGLGVCTIFDFRGDGVRARLPDPAFPGVRNVGVSALVTPRGTSVDFDLETLFSKEENVQAMLRWVRDGYTTMPFHNEAYRQLFAAAVAGKGPILFHCTAGKDRTGCAAALLLTALGVPRNVVLEDYLITNRCRAKSIALFESLMEPHFAKEKAQQYATLAAGVCAESLEAFFDAIAARYDTFEAYLAAELDVTAEMLHTLRVQYLV